MRGESQYRGGDLHGVHASLARTAPAALEGEAGMNEKRSERAGEWTLVLGIPRVGKCVRGWNSAGMLQWRRGGEESAETSFALCHKTT